MDFGMFITVVGISSIIIAIAVVVLVIKKLSEKNDKKK